MISADASSHDVTAGGTEQRALEVLRRALGDGARFRDGQLEAITRLVHDHARLLVVQRTGWGKSSVYFITTQLLREGDAGPTLLVSPLLALMRDQIRSAARFGLVAASIDSTNADEWPAIAGELREGEIDVLLVSPERLANAAFQRDVLEPMLPHVGLFVVDEAHCISDWGHDFRPDYRRIRGLLDRLDPQCAVLATTATANDVVVRDVVRQLGDDVHELRGPLSRSSLRLQATHIASEHGRMAWLAQHVGELPGSGIVYVLTKAHAAHVAAFLVAQGLRAEHYSGGSLVGRDAARKLEIERQLLANELDVVVATPALGMGFDKPDLGWVVHFQMPQSLVHLYQQVGRAGRAVDDAIGILLHGEGDQRITDYFIEAAFPPRAACAKVAAVLESAAPMPVQVADIARSSRVGRATVERVLAQLAVATPPAVRRMRGGWAAVDGAHVAIDHAHMQQLTERRHAEYARMQLWARGETCLMRMIAEELDDPTAVDCGRCSVCSGGAIIAETVDPELERAAREFTRPAASGRGRRRARRRRAPASTTARTKRRRRRS